MSLVIQRALDRSVDELLELTAACIAQMRALGIDQWDEVYPDRQTLSRDLAEGSLYTAGVGEELAGMFALNTHQDPEYAEVAWTCAGRVAVVHRLMVRPGSQQRGVGRALMAFAEQRAAELGHEVVRLDAFSLNPRALRLYEQLGYRRAGTVTFRKGLFYCFEKALLSAGKTA